MAQKTKTREINITNESGTFATFFKKFTGETKEFDFEGISAFRRLLSNERARLLYVLKAKKPSSMYELSKLLGRDFKSVNEDIKLLERFGFIEMTEEKTGNRKRLKPSLVIDELTVKIKI